MRTLALDTSSPACSVGVMDCDASGAALLAEINVWSPRGHMARLLPQIDVALKEAETAKEELEGLVVGLGPGSFTGLRIGVTIARTLAQLLEIPIVGVPSLDAMAHRLSAFEGAICPIIDAKRGELYAAVYKSSAGSVRRITGFRPIAPEALAYELRDAGIERILMAGDGVETFRDLISSHMDGRVAFAPREFWWPWAADLAYVAAEKLVSGETDDPLTLVPIYARLSQAEELWIARGER